VAKLLRSYEYKLYNPSRGRFFPIFWLGI
jgi:hypothetical protein